MGALAFIGLLVGLFLWAKESVTPNTPAENTRDLDGIMRDSTIYSLPQPNIPITFYPSKPFI
ncbi:hypothetical protein [Lacrimispora celerecrescens]|uniref:Uncharacterized protein n=1 Tax=Lacrimispora celerecrescens TaxID=29354 RepID=A0A084JFE6_9FIRM|nr:hypothetical protein [Lacrimispora celerecrescens]KEZ87680.1 hypothetical protein IO98_20500 [Lacrimispora celerecrescens]